MFTTTKSNLQAVYAYNPNTHYTSIPVKNEGVDFLF